MSSSQALKSRKSLPDGGWNLVESAKSAIPVNSDSMLKESTRHWRYTSPDCISDVWFENGKGGNPHPTKIIQWFEKKKARMETEMSDWRSVSDGLSLPFFVRRRVFVGESEEAVAVSELDIKELTVNCLRNQDFQVTPASGCIYIDNDSKAQQFSPGGLDLLDQHASYCIAQSSNRRQRIEWLPSNLLILALVAFGCTIFFAKRLLLKRSNACDHSKV